MPALATKKVRSETQKVRGEKLKCPPKKTGVGGDLDHNYFWVGSCLQVPFVHFSLFAALMVV